MENLSQKDENIFYCKRKSIIFVDNIKLLIMVEIGNFRTVGIDEWLDSDAFRIAVDLVWKKYKDAIVGYGYDKQVLVYSYSKMFAIENKETNDDNQSTANLHEIISKLCGKDRLVYLDDTDVQEYPIDLKLQKEIEEFENNGKLKFTQEFMLPEKYNHLTGQNPCWFKVLEINSVDATDVLDKFLQYAESTAKYMKLDLLIGELGSFDNYLIEDCRWLLAEFEYKISADGTHFYKNTRYGKK